MSTPETQAAAGPFTGILVVDLTHVLNGPFGTTLLCDLGARVIKVEPPAHGDDTRAYGPFQHERSLYFSCVNRGKESVALDLKQEGDRATFLNMIRKADVLTENFRPGTMEKLGFSYDELSKVNPRLVYASSSGFGQTGPLAQYPAYDTIVQAMSGIMSMTGFPDGPPTRVGVSISDLCGGVFMFCGIASALYARERSGKGARVDVAMFDATLAFLGQDLMQYIASGSPPQRLGNRHASMAPFDVFSCADKGIALCAGTDPMFARFCEAISRPDLISDARFLSNLHRVENHASLKAEIESALKQQPAAYWLKAIHQAGVPVGPLMDVAEAAEHPQTKARNMLIEAGGVVMAGNPVKISGYADSSCRPGAPALDQHGDAVRSEFGAARGGHA